jgi:osmotically-inducible protein OsmY
MISSAHEGPLPEATGKRTTGSFIDDEIIEIKSLVNISKTSPELQKSHISVTSFNGTVLLTGQVPDADSRALAEMTVKKLRKVKLVHNELTVSGPTSNLSRTSDAWISAKIKGRMLATKRFDSTRFKVVTENGVVYLMGLVTQDEAETAVALVRESHGIQKVVKMFEYIRKI